MTTIGVLAALAAPTYAATTVGQSAASSSCTSGAGQLMASTTTPPSYVIPSDGVITSFTAASVGSSGSTVLLILKPVSGFTYNVVAKSPPGAFTSTLQTFPTRVPAQSGELIGNYGTVCTLSTDDNSDVFRTFTGSEPATDADQDFPGSANTFRIDLSAQLEPDADHDGFGDETQDQCPTDASTQGPCPVAPVTPVTTVKKKKCKKHKKKNHSVQSAKKKKCKKKNKK